MSDKLKKGEWKIYSGQRTVPSTLGVGQHNYLTLVDPNDRVLAEIHGTAERGMLGGKLGIIERPVEYDDKGNRKSPNPLGLGDEDRANWVEVPPIKGASALETWTRFKGTAAKYDQKFDYRFLPSGKPLKFGSAEGQFYETTPSFNSNSAWRQILEENGYDWEKYHPKEEFFEFSPGDGHRLPSLGEQRPRRSRPAASPSSLQRTRPNRAGRAFGPGDLLR